MKMKKWLVIGSLLSGAASCALGAEITWGTVYNITGDTDVSTNGISIFAASFDDDTPSVTVNGVTFQGGVGASTVRDSSAYGDALNYSVNNDHSSAFTSASEPFASLSVDYQELLNGAIYSTLSSTVSVEMVIGNLTSNQEYEIQLWLNDPRIGTDRTITVDDVTTLEYSVGQVAGSPGQYVTGTFVADAETQAFDLSTVGGGWQLNAMQVRNLSDVTIYSVDPGDLNLIVVDPSTTVTGAVNVAFDGTAASVDVNVAVEGAHASAFSVVDPDSFTMTEKAPSNSAVQIAFDNDVAGLMNGETTTGMVNIVCNETGGSVYTTNTVVMTVTYIEDPVAASVFYQAGVMSNSDDWNNPFWTNFAYAAPQVPAAGNSYISLVGGQTRVQTGTFLGDSLELRASGGVLGLKVSPVTVSNLVLNAGTMIANHGGGGVLNGSIFSATNNGAGSITFSSGGESRNINITAPMNIGSNITSMIVNMGFHVSNPDEYVSVNSISNVFSGVWNVISGHLVGNAIGSLGTADFVVGENGYLNFNYDYDGTGKMLELATGGMLLLDQDLVFDQVSIGPWPLAAGYYTAAELLADPNYSSSIDAASTASLTVLSDPSEYKIALFTFSETNGVSSDVFAYSNVGEWGVTNAGVEASYTNASATFNQTANVAADLVSISTSPVDGNYHSFSFAVEGLAPAAVLNLNNLNLDYIMQSPLNFRLQIFSSVTGQGTNTFMTGDTPIYDSGLQNVAATLNISAALSDPAFQELKNGDEIEFRFVLSDGSDSVSRIHGIDNVELTGWIDDSQEPQVGEIGVSTFGSNTIVGWSGMAGVTYAVQFDNDLVYAPDFTNIVEGIVGVDAAMSYTNEASGSVGFYRVVLDVD
ncbi:hypothetical protein P4E94_17350 [Pontiellaceae bacterium B12219]|nr:hypothetical protein [Pontiellaceae bacterium B12219]